MALPKIRLIRSCASCGREFGSRTNRRFRGRNRPRSKDLSEDPTSCLRPKAETFFSLTSADDCPGGPHSHDARLCNNSNAIGDFRETSVDKHRSRFASPAAWHMTCKFIPSQNARPPIASGACAKNGGCSPYSRRYRSWRARPPLPNTISAAKPINS